MAVKGVKMGNNYCYLAAANTSEGYVSFFKYLLEDAKRVYILKGGPGCGKSTFMRKMGEELLSDGFDIDFIHSSDDSSSLDAIFIHDVNTVILDGNAPHIIDPKYPGAVERILDFGDYWDIDYLRNNVNEIKYYIDDIENEYKKFYIQLKCCKSIHDRWEAEYIKGMNFKKSEEITQKIINEVIRIKNNKPAKEWHRFSGAMTSEGQLCFYENLTQNIKNKYVVKGRPGTGKSTMTKKVAKAAMENGYDVEFYHCSFDPKSIDMIIIPEISFALLDGTAPHVFDPEKGDKLIDMFTCIDRGIVHEEEMPIKQIEEEYSNEMYKAKKTYKRIKELHDALEKYYTDAMDFNDVNALRLRITDTIKDMKKSE
jgi:tRNA uridine 5-carbamoylmethylation protein Kti12